MSIGMDRRKHLKSLTLSSAVLLLFSPIDARAAKARVIEGKIVSFECGDNCYLTITDVNQKRHTGLCVARECKAWNNEAEMPPSFVGKRVVLTVGTGTQLNSSGKVVNKMDSFTSIGFVP